MRTLFILGLLFLSEEIFASKDKLRELYWRATDDVAIRIFYQQAAQEPLSDAVVLAYQGVATAMQAQVADGIQEKIRYFSDGKAKIEEAVKLDPNNPEIRFLRFSIQSEVPAILGYRDHVTDDFQVMMYNLSQGQYVPSRDYCVRMKAFMLDSKVLDDQQKNQLKNISIV